MMDKATSTGKLTKREKWLMSRAVLLGAGRFSSIDEFLRQPQFLNAYLTFEEVFLMDAPGRSLHG